MPSIILEAGRTDYHSKALELSFLPRLSELKTDKKCARKVLSKELYYTLVQNSFGAVLGFAVFVGDLCGFVLRLLACLCQNAHCVV
jgi:hypothetical protein